ncbi:hypothetical protein BABINDRAFT_41248 [Babjeviella inositovora NRRL Y-12698]|uniref:Uricase n=1 Tax=Babjeviella inositovora NRRL Y-12698 TaxID=984486 RepID=A0A1E3QJ11_9ASCO|nr:uncharacterized protein BABINDRAFT_41248 [Babjeviella inositovora NRRL Y-12698]ODQ77685.1 hypothetical protein BABINDRAFT_41248 [Babjeviella inositovora NRRL Y-12698]
MAVLLESSYGKNLVKFLKVKRDATNPKKQEVIEATCCVLLEGAFDESYTNANNASIVPTDTVKNTILVEAKLSDVWPIERFAAHLGQHFVNKYSHVTAVNVWIEQQRWVKYDVNGKPHDHSFIHQSGETKNVYLHYFRNGKYDLQTSIKGLTVLKSTGSMFYGYNVCDYTTLKPTKDRILSTDVDATWYWDSKKLGPITNIERLANAGLFDNGYDAARKVTLDLFALENSPSVQATMYNMSAKILELVPEVEKVQYSLPNKHYMGIDLSFKGIRENNEVFYPAAHPSGLIKSTVGREVKAKF